MDCPCLSGASQPFVRQAGKTAAQRGLGSYAGTKLLEIEPVWFSCLNPGPEMEGPLMYELCPLAHSHMNQKLVLFPSTVTSPPKTLYIDHETECCRGFWETFVGMVRSLEEASGTKIHLKDTGMNQRFKNYISDYHSLTTAQDASKQRRPMNWDC